MSTQTLGQLARLPLSGYAPNDPEFYSAPTRDGRILKPGDVVHFVVPPGTSDALGFHRLGGPGTHAVGVVTHAWQTGGARIQIEIPTERAIGKREVYWCEATEQDETEKRPGTWHWPE